MKQCATCLLRYYGGDSRGRHGLSVYVGLSRAGLPKIIPSHHRNIIMKRNERSDQLVKLYLSWFSLTRILILAARVSKATFSSLFDDPGAEVCGELKQEFKRVADLYVPWLPTVPLQKGIQWVPSWKSMPNNCQQCGDDSEPSFISNIKLEVLTYLTREGILELFKLGPPETWWEMMGSKDLDFDKFVRTTLKSLLSPVAMFIHGILYPYDNAFTTEMLIEDERVFREDIKLSLVSAFMCPQAETHAAIFQEGRLSQVLAGATKRPLFVIGNSFLQRLLYPAHSWAMTVLSRLPNDGTYNQSRPIIKLLRLKAKANI